MRVLVIEASTSAAKAMVYDDEKGVLALTSEKYSRKADENGVNDAALVYDICIRAGRRAATGHDIAAVACAGGYGTAYSPARAICRRRAAFTCGILRKPAAYAAPFARMPRELPLFTGEPAVCRTSPISLTRFFI